MEKYIEVASKIKISNRLEPSCHRTPEAFAEHAIYSKLVAAFAEFIQPKTTIEVGVCAGVTTSHLCKVSGHVFGFDFWDECDKEVVEQILTGMGFNNFTLTRKNTLDSDFPAVLKEKCPVIDFAYIDGDHTYNGILNDFKAVYPLLSETGVIAFHDTNRIDGCREFMLELRAIFSDGTFDIINLLPPHDPWHYGLSFLVKRLKPMPIEDISGSKHHAKAIVEMEKVWLEFEQINAIN